MRVTAHGGSNHIGVEKPWDELCIGVKCQTNAEIAGSPRNSFRASVLQEANGGKALIGLGAFTGLPNSVKLRIPLCGYNAVRQCGLSYIVERETAQTNS